MLFDELKQLPDLVRLCLSSHILQVQQLGDRGVNEDVVAAVDPREAEAEGHRQGTEIHESEIVG